MKETVMQPNSKEIVEMENSKVGFLRQVTTDKPINCAVDGIPIACGIFNPPYIVKRNIIFLNKDKTATVIYNMDIFDDTYNIQQPKAMTEIKKEDEFIKTEPRRPKSGHIYNHILNNANQWYEIKIPDIGILSWSLRLRENHNLLYSYDPSHATYSTLKSGETLTEDTSPNKGINAIYVMCETAETIVEFEVWTDGNYKKY